MAQREQAILARNPRLSLVIRTLRLERMSQHARWTYAVGAVGHVAGRIPALTEMVADMVEAMEREADDALRLRLDDARAEYADESAEERLLRAVSTLWLLYTEERATHASEAAALALEALEAAQDSGGPPSMSVAAEEAWQEALFVSLWERHASPLANLTKGSG